MGRLDFRFKPLRFPREVGSYEVPNFVRFVPKKIEYGKFNKEFQNEYGNSFSSANKTGGSFAGSGYANAESQLRDGVGGIIDNIANGAKGILSSLSQGNFNIAGNFDLFGGNLTARVDIGNLGLKATGLQEDSKVTSKTGINLYMPPQLASQLGADYSKAELGALFAAAMGMDTTAAIADSVKKAMGGDFGAAMESALSGGVEGLLKDGVDGGIAYGIDKARSNATARNTLQRFSGRVMNSYSYQMFNGMKHRQFNYSFRLVARNQDDTHVIKDICDQFMEYMLPVKDPDNTFHLYDIPHMWDIEYYRHEELNTFLDQPNRCFLQDCNVVYSGDGMGHTHNNGAPLIVDLSLSFIEIEPMFSSGKGAKSPLSSSNPFAEHDQDARTFRTGGNFSGGAG